VVEHAGALQLNTTRVVYLKQEVAMDFETLIVRKDGGVLFVDIAAPPMNLLGPELVRDLV
jgi:hypothetical protein